MKVKILPQTIAKISLLLSFVLALTAQLYAQTGTYAWAQELASTKKEESVFVATDRVGNTFVALTFEAELTVGSETYPKPTENGRDVIVVKYAPDGTVLWSRSISGPGAPNVGGRGDRITGLAADPAGNVYILGHHDAGGSIFGKPASGERGFVAKASPEGVLEWVDYPVAVANGSRFPLLVQAVAFDSVANTLYVGGASSAGASLSFLRRYAPDGTPSELIRLGQRAAILAFSGDTLLVSGRNGGSSRLTLGSYSRDGATMHWLRTSKLVSGDDRSRALGIRPLADGSMLAMFSAPGRDIKFENELLSDGPLLNFGFVWRVGPDGSSLGVRVLSDQFTPPVDFRDSIDRFGAITVGNLAVAGDNRFFLTGSLSESIPLRDGRLLRPDGGYSPVVDATDMLVLELDSAFTIVGAALNTGNGFQFGRDVALAPGGEVCVAGEFQYFSGFLRAEHRFGDRELLGAGDRDGFVTRVRTGELPRATSLRPGGFRQNTNLVASPNPAHEVSTLTRSGNLGQGEWRLFDAVGREVSRGTWPAGDPRLALPLSDLPVGIYRAAFSSSSEAGSTSLVVTR